MKPLIGIITRPELSTGKYPMMGIYKSVINAVVLSGGIPVGIIPPEKQFYFNKTLGQTSLMTNESLSDMKTIINQCQGIICQGGDDFYDYDLKAIEYCHNNDIPLLGICLGMQTMGVLFGGKLHKLPNEEHDNQTLHTVYLKDNSKLYDILKEDVLKVNSRHRESLLTTNLDVVGISEDGVIEAIEDKTKKFFIGVQWHPETMIYDDELMKKLFGEFINTCKEVEKNGC